MMECWTVCGRPHMDLGYSVLETWHLMHTYTTKPPKQVLAGRKTGHGTVGGSILVNGRTLSPEVFKSISVRTLH